MFDSFYWERYREKQRKKEKIKKIASSLAFLILVSGSSFCFLKKENNNLERERKEFYSASLEIREDYKKNNITEIINQQNENSLYNFVKQTIIEKNKFNKERRESKLKEFKTDLKYLIKYSNYYNIPFEISLSIYLLENSSWKDVSISKKYGPMQIGKNELYTLLYYFIKDKNKKTKIKKGWLYQNFPEIGEKIENTIKKYGKDFFKLRYSLKNKNKEEIEEILDSYYAFSLAYVKWIYENTPKSIKKSKNSHYLYTIMAYHAGIGVTNRMIKERYYSTKHFEEKKEYNWMVKVLKRKHPRISVSYLKEAREMLKNLREVYNF